MKITIKNIRLNQQIKASRVRLIDQAGRHQGVVERTQALEWASQQGLDLVQLTDKTDPPVCRIMDFGKYQYQQNKKERQQRAKQKRAEVKGIRLGLQTDQHDLLIKAKQAERFLSQNQKVRIEIILRGRQKAALDLAKEKINRFVEMIGLATKNEEEVKRTPRGLSLVIVKRR